MSAPNRPSCIGCPLHRTTRRRFLAACGAGALAAGPFGALAAETRTAEKPAGRKPRVRLVFTHIPRGRPTWPYISYDYEARKKELTERLTRACPEVEFLPATVKNRGEASRLLKEDKDIDAYLIYMLGIWTGAPQTIAGAGRPCLFVDDLYGGSGEWLIAYAAARRRGWKVEGIASTRFEDVVAAARCFPVLTAPGGGVDRWLETVRKVRLERTRGPAKLTPKEDKVQVVPVAKAMERLRASHILTVGGGWGMPRIGKAIAEVFGTKVTRIEFPELAEAYEKADRKKAAEFADRWMAKAEKVVEPDRKTIEDSGAMYLAMKAVMERRRANAITINCLGGFYGGHLKAYPCLGFCQFNDGALVGACESDVPSTITMLVMKSLVGRPGYISDPVMDIATRQIIYAHCVAPTKPFGPDGPTNPCHIRSHSEDRKGAALRSLLPLGYMTTTMKIEPVRREIILHQGVTVANIDEDKACRTKLAAEPLGDYEKLYTEWDRWGWHRVTFYGDLVEPVRELAKATGLKIVEET